MKKRLMFATMVVLAMLVVVTPVLAAGSGSQNGELEQNQGETQSQEHNQIGSGQQNGELERNQGETQSQEHNQIGSGQQNGELEQNQGETQNQEHNQIGSGQQNGELEQNQGTTQNQEQNKIGPADSADAILGEVLSANRFVMSLVESVLGLLG